ncbi:MAG: SAM-dependent chlorinase/fluorinase [Rhodospirillaceae bacterium]
MIFLFSDFGLTGPYTGQVKAVLMRAAPEVPVIDLFADAPCFDPQLSAYLLAAYTDSCMTGDVYLCIVDPGVGTDRRPLVLHADGRWFVGPDNGLFELVRRRSKLVHAWVIDWVPPQLSATFHGRDLFAPIAARLALGEASPGLPLAPDSIARPTWPDELARVVYIDGYGNVMVGIRAKSLRRAAMVDIDGLMVKRHRSFADVSPGEPLWCANANGLLEIAVNQGNAANALNLRVGSPVKIVATLPHRGTPRIEVLMD